MSELVFKENNQILTTSRNVARDFEKEHRNITRGIESLLKNEHTPEDCFIESTYIHPVNRQRYKEYLINKDGFTLLVMGFTGNEAMKFKVNYMNAFNEMEKQLNQPMSPTELALLQAQNVYELEQRVEQQDSKIVSIEKKVENEITLSYGEQRRLQKAVARRVYELYDNKEDRPLAFSSIYREIKDRFAVASYKDVRRQDLQAAINYIGNWIPRKVAI